MTQKTYAVEATKSGKYWYLDVEGIPQGTQVRRISEAEDMVKELISIFTGEVQENIKVSIDIHLPQNIAEIRNEADQLFEKAKASNALAAEKARQAAHLMREEGLTYKEIGYILNVSHQRAAQLSA